MGLLGCGRVVERWHLPAILGDPDCRVVAAWDPRPERRQWIERAASDVRLAESEDELLDTPAVDAFLIASPPSYHPRQAIGALQRGRPVLIEKPMALDPESARRIHQAADEAGVPACVGFNRRHQPGFRRLRTLLTGTGPLSAVSFELWSASEEWGRVAPHEPGTDALNDLACHQIDLARWLLATQVVEVSARADGPTGDADTAVRYRLRMASGVEVDARAAQAGVYHERIRARAGRRVAVGGPSVAYWLPADWAPFELAAALLMKSVARAARWPDPAMMSIKRQLVAFRRLVTGEAPVLDLAEAEDGLWSAQVIHALQLSLRADGKQISLADDGTAGKEGSIEDPRRPPASPARLESGREPVAASVSVVLVVGNRRRRGARALASLLQQEGIDRVEILLIDAGDERDQAPLPGSEHRRVRTLRPHSPESFGGLRALGAAEARGELVAFMEEHVIALPGWLAAVEAQRHTSWAAVGGEMHNGNPGVGISDTVAMMNYTAWQPPAQAGPSDYIPGQNNVYRRSVLARYHQELPWLLDNEALFNARLRADGFQLAIDPAIRFSHWNEASLGHICRGYFHWHRNYGHGQVKLGGRGWPWRLARAAMWPLVPPVRVVRMGRHIFSRRPPEAGLFLRSVPVILIAQSAAALGTAVGAVFGPGRSPKTFLDHELNADRPLAA